MKKWQKGGVGGERERRGGGGEDETKTNDSKNEAIMPDCVPKSCGYMCIIGELKPSSSSQLNAHHTSS